MPRGEGWRYAGIDETNHGRFPEIFVAVYSDFPEDISKKQCTTSH